MQWRVIYPEFSYTPGPSYFVSILYSILLFVYFAVQHNNASIYAFLSHSPRCMDSYLELPSPQHNRAGLGCGSDHGARGRFEKKQTRGIYTPTVLWRSPSKGVSNIGSSSPLNEHWPPPSISPSALWSRSRSRSSPSPRAPSRTLDTVRDEYWVRI